MLGLHIVWFRNDLRVHDHAALRAAVQSADRDGGRVVALYIFEPETDVSAGRQRFLIESLRDLQTALDRRGAQLHLRSGVPVEVFSELHRAHRILSIHGHEAPHLVGPDRQIEAWAMRAGVALRVHQQYGPLPLSSGFFEADSDWEAFMSEPRREASDVARAADIGVGYWPELTGTPGMDADARPGGRRAALALLRTVLGSPSNPGSIDRSDVGTGVEAYHVLKPYLEIGALSVRETWQAAISARQQYMKSGHEIQAAILASFIQCLPGLHLEKHQRSSGNRQGRARPTSYRKTEDSDQMSFGFRDPRQA